jgi:hypothetical protein
MSLFVYTSKQAYNSCLGMFPAMVAANPGSSTQGGARNAPKEKGRLSRIKEQIRLNRMAQQKARMAAPARFRFESVLDIIHEREEYVDSVPVVKMSSPPDTKITFQKQRQIEFEENSDIDHLHKMFPDVPLSVIYCQYQQQNSSLNSTIDVLLTRDFSSDNVEEISPLDIEDESLWPSLVTDQVATKLNLEKEDVTVTSTFDDSSWKSEYQDVESFEDSDFVMVLSRENSMSSINTESTCGWVDLQSEQLNDRPTMTYKEMLLVDCKSH